MDSRRCGPNFKNHENYFKNIDEYNLVVEPKKTGLKKKKNIVLQIVELTIDVSNRRSQMIL